MTSPLSSCHRLSKPIVEGVTDPVADPVTDPVTGQVAPRTTPPVNPPVTPPVTGEVAGQVTGEVTGQVEAHEAQEAQANEVLATFRDRVCTEMFPGRTDLPKTLIFAKDDAHADDIVRLCREVFGNPAAKRVLSFPARGHGLWSVRICS